MSITLIIFQQCLCSQLNHLIMHLVFACLSPTIVLFALLLFQLFGLRDLCANHGWRIMDRWVDCNQNRSKSVPLLGDHRKDTISGELLYVQVPQCSLAVRLEHTWMLESIHTILILDSSIFHLFGVWQSFCFRIKHCQSSYFAFFPCQTLKSVGSYISSYSSRCYIVSAVQLHLINQARSTVHIWSMYKSSIMQSLLASYVVNFRHNEWQHS